MLPKMHMGQKLVDTAGGAIGLFVRWWNFELTTVLDGFRTDVTGLRSDVTGLRTDINSVLRPPALVTPTNIGDLSFQATSNTSLTFKFKGSDGVVRSGSITLA